MSNEILNEILIRSSSLILRCTPCINHPGNNNIIPGVDGCAIFVLPIKFPFIFSKNENDIYKYLEIQNDITIEKELGLFDQFVKLYSDILNNKIKNFEYSKYEDLIYRYKFINNLHKGQ